MNRNLFNQLHCRCRYLWICWVLFLGATDLLGDPMEELIFSHAFGFSGNVAGAFNAPSTVALDSQDRIIIADQLNHRVQVCSLSGECRAFGSMGDAPGRFNLPAGVAVNSNGQIIVADTGNNRVQICSLMGECEVLSDELGQPRAFVEPLDVAVGSDDRIVISEYRRGFQICRAASGCAIFDHPGLRWLAVDRNDQILSTNGTNVFICDFSGNCENAFGRDGGAVGEFRMAHDLITDDGGRIFIADQGNARVQICDYSGDCRAFDIHRYASQLMYWPAGIGLTSDRQLVIADREGDRIHVYDLIEFEGPAIPINVALNDAWYDPKMPGQGFFINVFDKAKQSMFVAWFTYDIERPDESISAMFGDAGHRWLTAQGIYHTYTATLDLYNTSGLFFLTNPDDPLTEAYGTMSLRFSDCGKGTIYYDIPSVDHNSTVPIVRLTEDSQRFCEQLLGDSQHRSSVFTPD